MRLASLPPTWQGWIAAFQSPLHERLAWRLEPMMLGVIMAKGRRTVTSWLRAAGLQTGWEDFYYFLAAIGKGCEVMAMLVLRLLVRNLPKAVPAGQRGRGRPRTYGKQRISLLKRAGQKRGWQQVTCRQYGKEVVKTIKTFEATYKPAQGRIRVVLVKEAHGWLPYFCTDPTMAAATILEQVADRGALEQDYHDLKEVEGTGQQQVRNLWANIGAFHLTMWAHCLTELWAWYQPQEALCARSDSPWDNPQRRPSHADRRKALQRHCLAEEFSHVSRRQPVASEIQRFISGLIHQAA